MWFYPAELAKTRTCTPTTFATLATFPEEKEVMWSKVAEVAKVATSCNLKTVIQVVSNTDRDVVNLAWYAWLIHFQDRDSLMATFTPDATHKEVLASYSGAVAAEPLASMPMPDDRGLTPSDTDDRRTCRQCANLKGGICSIATPGGAVSAPIGYQPAPDLLQRCEGSEVKPYRRLALSKCQNVPPNVPPRTQCYPAKSVESDSTL